MHQYTVIASSPEMPIVVVQDAQGRCHLGCALAASPPPGTCLHGDAPGIGLRSLRQVAADQPCPVVLVLLDCNAEVAARLVAVGPA